MQQSAGQTGRALSSFLLSVPDLWALQNLQWITGSVNRGIHNILLSSPPSLGNGRAELGAALSVCALLFPQRTPQGHEPASQVPLMGQCVDFPATNCFLCQGCASVLHSLPYSLPGLLVILNFVGWQKGGCASLLSPKKAPVSWGVFDSFIWAVLFVLCAILAAQMGGNWTSYPFSNIWSRISQLR